MLQKYLKFECLPPLFLKLFLVTFPFQIQTLLYKASWFSGQFNYFTAFFLNISEGLLILSLLTWAIERFRKPPELNKPLLADRWGDVFLISLCALVLWGLLAVFWATDKNLALLYAFRWLELAIVVFLIGQEVVKSEVVLKYLWWGAFVQVLIGLGQYLRQGDLGLWFLGEPKLGADYFNIAKIDLGGEKILRSYGTFAHANIFGGFLFISLALILKNLTKDNYIQKSHFLIVFLLGLLISFSRSAWLALLILLLVMWGLKAMKFNWKQLLLTLVLLTFVMVVFSIDQILLARIWNFSLSSWDERLIFSGIARDMIGHNYLLGVGPGNFVLMMPNYVSQTIASWLYQPAHNFFLLTLSELGLPGLLLWLITFFSTVKMVLFSQHRKTVSQKYSAKVYLGLLSGIGFLLLIDHYFYTIWAGQVLLALVMGLVWADYRKRQRELAE